MENVKIIPFKKPRCIKSSTGSKKYDGLSVILCKLTKDKGLKVIESRAGQVIGVSDNYCKIQFYDDYHIKKCYAIDSDNEDPLNVLVVTYA